MSTPVSIVCAFLICWGGYHLVLWFVNGVIRKHRRLQAWMNDGDGVTLRKIIWWPWYMFISFLALIMMVLFGWAAYSLAKDVRNWARRKN